MLCILILKLLTILCYIHYLDRLKRLRSDRTCVRYVLNLASKRILCMYDMHSHTLVGM